MKHLYIICTLIICTIHLYGQEINIREVTQASTNNDNLPKYDTTTMYVSFNKLIENPNFYDGQKIMFLPTSFKENRVYNHISGFSIMDSVHMTEYPDTVWVRKRKTVKEGDFRINMKKTDVYKGVNIVNKDSKAFGYVVTSNIYACFDLRNTTGLATPFEYIEGQTFYINSCSVTHNNNSRYKFIFLLKDKDNIDIKFEFTHYHSGRDIKKSFIFPAMLTAFYEKCQTKYLGNSFVIKQPESYTKYDFVAKKINGGNYKVIDGELNCIDISFLANKYDYIGKYKENVVYLTPFLVFQDKGKSELLISLEKSIHYIPGTNKVMPNELTDILINQLTLENRLLSDYEKIEGTINSGVPIELTTINLMRAEEYYAELKAKEEKRIANEEAEKQQRIAEEEQRIAKAKAEKQQRLANAEAVKQAEIKRVNSILKKYGKSMGEFILSGKLKLGMTKAMCLDSQGSPQDINTSIGSWGTHEQWVYSHGTYLYFENEVLTSIQH